MLFEWDDNKNAANIHKHGVNFRQASQVFLDPLHVSVQDRIVSGEERWQTYGVVDGVLLLMVASTMEEESGDTLVRIISARNATKRERRVYEEENRSL